MLLCLVHPQRWRSTEDVDRAQQRANSISKCYQHSPSQLPTRTGEKNAHMEPVTTLAASHVNNMLCFANTRRRHVLQRKIVWRPSQDGANEGLPQQRGKGDVLRIASLCHESHICKAMAAAAGGLDAKAQASKEGRATPSQTQRAACCVGMPWSRRRSPVS